MDGPDNSNRSPSQPERAFDPPFIGYAAGNDPYWDGIKLAAGQEHWTPLEAFSKAYPGAGVTGWDLSVVVIVCPQTKATVDDQKKAKGFPAERWIRSRFFHDEIVSKLCRRLAEFLSAQGIQAVVPDQLESFSFFPHPSFQITSNWSHRHAAFAAGLGTFGLCDALITKVGKAHRLGSLIVRHRFEPGVRAYKEPYEYCLYLTKGTCLKCLDRCPAGALSQKGHDKTLCQGFLNSTAPRIKTMYPDISGAYGCGLCQAAVPCGKKIPRAVIKLSD
jgi:epoxyqueuosine reductase QueG